MDARVITHLYDAVLASSHVLEMMAESDADDSIGRRTEQLALWKLLDVIGDSVNEIGHLAPAFVAGNPDLGAVATLRQRIAPEYDRPDFPLMFNIARMEIPVLHEHLVALMPADSNIDGELTT